MPSAEVSCAFVALSIATLAASSRAHAEEAIDLGGTRIVVLAASGRASWGTKKLTASVRKTLEASIGSIVPAAKFSAEAKKRRLTGDEIKKPEAIAGVARAIDAQYALSLEVSRTGWLYTAHAILLDAATGERRMDFRAQYYKPNVEAIDRGVRIAEKTIWKLGVLKNGEKAAPEAEFAGTPATLIADGSGAAFVSQIQNRVGRAEDGDAAERDVTSIETPVDKTVPVGVGLGAMTTISFFHSDGGTSRGQTYVNTLRASYAFAPWLAGFFRIALASNAPPDAPGAMGLSNPVVGAAYALMPADGLRLGLSFAAMLPVGSGGGNSPDPAVLAAMKAAGRWSGFMFSTNELGLAPSAEIAWTYQRLTLQLRTIFNEQIRTRGEAISKDATRAAVLFDPQVAVDVFPVLALWVEYYYFRYLSTPAGVVQDPTSRDLNFFIAGARFTAKIDETSAIKPSILFARALDQPFSRLGLEVVQLDVAYVF